jgi:enamine deaminase RidA (YjgF/YER057c/UK114 family)
MSDYIVKSEEYKGFTINIKHDESPENPRGWSDFGIMCCKHSRYTLGDVQIPDYYTDSNGEDVTIEDEKTFRAWFESQHGEIGLIAPLYLYDHSGITIKTTPFGDRWDSGQVGWIAMSKDSIRKEMGVKKLTKAVLENAKAMFYGQVELYDDYLTGNVYGYELERDGEFIDSCYGFYGYDDIDHCITEAKTAIDSLLENQPDTWKVTVELTVFAGDMDKDNVISNAEKILSDITDGTDFTSYSVVNAKRDL